LLYVHRDHSSFTTQIIDFARLTTTLEEQTNCPHTDLIAYRHLKR